MTNQPTYKHKVERIRQRRAGNPGNVANDPKRLKFMELLQSGMMWTPALTRSGLMACEAAQMIDDLMLTRRDGVTIWMLSEKYLYEAMEALKKLAKNATDEKVRLMAAAKLSDTAYRVLIHKPYLEKLNTLKEIPGGPDCLLNTNVWDAQFEGEQDVCSG